MPSIITYFKKRILSFIIVIFTFFSLIYCEKPLEKSTFYIRNFDKEWEFRMDSSDHPKKSEVGQFKWKPVNLPHDWSIQGEFNDKNPSGAREAFLPTGTGWYRKEFKLPKDLKTSKISIRFDGIYRNSTVWINGHQLGNRPNGYVEIKYDLTPHLKFDNQINILEVKVDNSAQPNSRWYTGSGIYRHVWLESTGQIHFDRWGIQVTTPDISSETALMNIRSTVINESTVSENIILKTILFNSNGDKITEKEQKFTSAPNGKTKILQKIEIPNPKLWSPDNPNTYTIKNILKKDNKITDIKEITAGIRNFNFDPNKGFSLNGQSMKIKGVCLHSAAGAVGAAVPEGILEYRLKKLKDLGCNAIRFSHNPASPEVLNMCDNLGFLVMTEAFDEWQIKKKWGPDYGYHIYFDQWHKQDLSEMIRRDFNHPSIIMYSIGNEIQEQRDGLPQGVQIAKELVDICHREDPTRPVTSACDQIPNANKTGLAQVLDIVGYNYQNKYYQEDHKKYPERIILGSETHQFPLTWTSVKNNAFVAGEFLWVGFDYLGEADHFPLKGWENGMFDTTGNIKPRGLLRRTLWNEEPQVYIFSQNTDWKKDTSVFAPWSWEKLYAHWNWPDLKGKMINVKCYTNCDEVELFLNGKSIGTKEMSDISSLPLSWQIKYNEGILKAIAKKDGKIVTENILKTSGKAKKLVLKSSKEQIRNDGSDVSVIHISVVDQDGIVVPDNHNLIRFHLEGEGVIIAVDNGNLRSNEKFQGDKRMAYNGKAICIVKATGTGQIKLTTTSKDLEPDSLIINVKEN